MPLYSWALSPELSIKLNKLQPTVQFCKLRRLQVPLKAECCFSVLGGWGLQSGPRNDSISLPTSSPCHACQPLGHLSWGCQSPFWPGWLPRPDPLLAVQAHPHYVLSPFATSTCFPSDSWVMQLSPPHFKPKIPSSRSRIWTRIPSVWVRDFPLPLLVAKNAKKTIFHRLGKGCKENPMQMGAEA